MRVRASFGSPAPAAPGEMARVELTLENTGDRTEDLRLALTGEATGWGWITPATLTLDPGATGVAAVTVKPPRAPSPAAGPVTLTVSISTAGAAADTLAVDVPVEIAPFVELYASLDPPASSGRRSGHHVLSVENRGNTSVAATVEGRGEELAIAAEPNRVHVGPGASAEVRVTARTTRRPLWGKGATRDFEVVVRPEGHATAARASGRVELAPSGWAGRAALALLVLALAAFGLRAGLRGSDGGDTGGETAGGPAGVGSPASPDCPARDHLSPDANGIVREGVQPSFDYTFLFVTDDGCRPVRFNPCQSISYAVNRGGATDAHIADLDEALRKMAQATGLEFERVADTDEDPRRVPRPRRQADGTLAWPPIVIGWSRLGSGDALRGRNDDRASPDVVVGGGGRPEIVDDVIVTGNLVLNLDVVTDTDTRAPVPHGFGPGVNWGRIILHELAHVIGLGHVESRTSLMNESLTRQTISSSEWGVGDLAGLRQLGREAGCLDVPPVPLQGAPR